MLSSYRSSPSCSNLVQDYYKGDLKGLFGHKPPDIKDFKNHFTQRQKDFKPEYRNTLSSVLKKQAQKVSNTHANTLNNISILKEASSFTVTTGHQINLFTGPLFFWYKIISTINLSKKLKQYYPKHNFIPVYWMASEDHDFQEINHFYFKGEKIYWEQETNQAFVGSLSTQNLDKVFFMFSKALGLSSRALELKNLFKEAYLEHNNLSDATRYLVNHFFSKYGLVVIDANDAKLKQLAMPIFEKELTESIVYSTTEPHCSKLKENGYPVQQKPSLCNLFYHHEGSRLKLIPDNESFKLGNSKLVLTQKDILNTLKEHPERFSPNVLLRPLYQESILPNLAYLGGAKELDYWLELDPLFKAYNTTFPILMLRNTAFLINQEEKELLKKLNVHSIELLGDVHPLINKHIKLEYPTPEIDEIEHTIKTHLSALLNRSHRDLTPPILGKKKLLLKHLNQLERKITSHQKKYDTKMTKDIFRLKQALYPMGLMQERKMNFSEIYLQKGAGMIELLMAELDPFREHVLEILI